MPSFLPGCPSLSLLWLCRALALALTFAFDVGPARASDAEGPEDPHGLQSMVQQMLQDNLLEELRNARMSPVALALFQQELVAASSRVRLEDFVSVQAQIHLPMGEAATKGASGTTTLDGALMFYVNLQPIFNLQHEICRAVLPRLRQPDHRRALPVCQPLEAFASSADHPPPPHRMGQ